MLLNNSLEYYSTGKPHDYNKMGIIKIGGFKCLVELKRLNVLCYVANVLHVKCVANTSALQRGGFKQKTNAKNREVLYWMTGDSNFS